MKIPLFILAFFFAGAVTAAGVFEQSCDEGGLSRIVNDTGYLVVCTLRLNDRFVTWEVYPGDATPCYRIVAWRCG